VPGKMGKKRGGDEIITETRAGGGTEKKNKTIKNKI